MRLMTRKGMSTAEYAVMASVVVAAIVLMSRYAQRGVQAKMKDATDFYTSQGATVGTTKQYEPYYTSTDYNVTQNRSSTDVTEKGGRTSRTGISETTKRTGSSTTGVNTGADDNWR